MHLHGFPGGSMERKKLYEHPVMIVLGLINPNCGMLINEPVVQMLPLCFCFFRVAFCPTYARLGLQTFESLPAGEKKPLRLNSPFGNLRYIGYPTKNWCATLCPDMTHVYISVQQLQICKLFHQKYRYKIRYIVLP